MSQYTETATGKNRMLRFLDVVWRTSPRVKSDAARFYAFEVAQAAALGLITTWRGDEWGVCWHITTKGLKLLTASRATTMRK